MIIKRKSTFVIFFSSSLITLVLVITLAAFYLYLNFKEENNKLAYQKSLYELNAQLFAKYVDIASVILKIGDKGYFRNRPIFEGKITNRSDKKILSLKIKVAVMDSKNKTIYSTSLYPIQPETYLTVIPKGTGNFLAPGDSISFKHILKNYPKDIMTILLMKNTFAKGKDAEKLNIDYKIEGLIVE